MRWHDPYPDIGIREAIKIGHPKHVETAINHPNFTFRQEVARYGSAEDKTKLLKDKNFNVKHAIARTGKEDHHKVLMHDPDPDIRGCVASYTESYNVLKHLANDEDSCVRNAAKDRIDDEFTDYNPPY